MKSRSFLCLCCLWFLGTVGLADDARTWTSSDGRTLRGRYLRATESQVTLLRESDRKTFSIPLSALSEEDQTWVAERRKQPPSAPGPQYAEGKQEKEGRIFYASHLGVANKPVTHLLVWCHPGSGQAQPEFKWMKQSLRLKQHRILLFAPQAKERLWAENRDADFVEGLITDAMKRYGLTRDKVMLGGHSSGAVFTHNFGPDHAAQIGHLIAACGLMQSPPKRMNPSQPQSLMVYHSPNDGVFAFSKAKKADEPYRSRGYNTSFIEDKQGHSIGPKLANAIRDHIQTEL